MPAKELFTVYAYSSNAQASGEFALVSDAWNGAVELLRLPLGCVFKVWEERLDGPQTTAYMELSYDCGSTYTVMGCLTNVAQSGQVAFTHLDVVRTGRPAHIINVDTSTNNKIVKWRFEQATGSTAQMLLNCEITSDV